jgi:hypothetical protein
MRYICLSIILIAFSKLSFSQTEKLENGIYQVNINSENLECYDLIIKDSSFVENHKNETLSGKIKWIGKNSFELIYDKESENKFTELIKKIHSSFGNYRYEISSSSNNRYRLKITYSFREDIIVNTGELVKKEIKKIKLPR